MKAKSAASQVLERHESQFDHKKVMVAGDVHDRFVLQLAAKKLFVHCTQFHIYQMLSTQADHIEIDFGLLPPSHFFEQADTLIYYWPKNKVEAQFQLAYLLNGLNKDVDIFIVGENRCGVKSAENLLADFGHIQKIDSARRCGLYYFKAESRSAFALDEWWHQYHLELDHIALSVHALPGVFSQRNLDSGSELLLNALYERADLVKGNVLEIGCGCGVLSAFLAKMNSAIQLTATDVSAAALASTEKTLAENHIQAHVLASDVFSHITERFDLIVSNPPFHDGKETSYDAVNALIQQAKSHLSLKGKLCIVANSFLPYQSILIERFKHVDVLAQTSKFKVYLAND